MAYIIIFIQTCFADCLYIPNLAAIACLYLIQVRMYHIGARMLKTKKIRLWIMVVVAGLVLFAAFYTYGMFLMFKINATAENSANLRQQYTDNTKGLASPGSIATSEAGVSQAIEIYRKNDNLLLEMKDNESNLGRDIQLAKKIVIPRKYRVDLVDKYEEILQLDLRIIGNLTSPADRIDSLTAEFWDLGSLKAKTIIESVSADAAKGDQTKMQNYLEGMKKINEAHKIYEDKIIPLLDEIYKGVPNHKKDYRIWVQREGDYYLSWGKYCQATVNKDSKNVLYYTDKLNADMDWFAKNPSVDFTKEISDAMIVNWNTRELPDIHQEIDSIWTKIYLLRPFYLPLITIRPAPIN